jgi:hypothetical protein
VIKRIEQYKVFLILFSLLLLTTIISTYNPFKISLLAADNIPACISTCTDYTGNYYGDCERFCDPYSSGYYGYENSCAYQSYPEGNTEQWCSSVEMDVEMCIGGCIAENPDATDVEYSCRDLCSAYNDKYGCENNYGAYLQGGYDFTPSTSFCSYLDFRDEVGSCYTACTTELGAGYDMDCSTFCNPYDHGYYGYEWQVGGTGGCTEASQYYNYDYPQPGLWCSYLEKNSQMCTGACIAQNSSYQDPEFPCNDICTAYTVTSECAADAGSYFEYFIPTTDFCSYLEYGVEHEEDGIYLNGTIRGYMQIETGGVKNITGYVRHANMPDDFTILGNNDNNYSNDIAGDCTLVAGTESDKWEFSCPTDDITGEGIYQYTFTTSNDADLWESSKILTINYGIDDLTYLWTFDERNEDWGNEVITNLAPTEGGATQTDPGFHVGGALNGLDEKYLTYEDLGGDFNFAGGDVHFKIEAMVKGNAYDNYDRMLISKRSNDEESNTWTVGTSGDRGVRCAVEINGEQQTTQTEWETGGQLTNGETYKIGCEWNAYTRELTAYIDDVAIITNTIGGTDFIPPSTSNLTINGIPGVGYDTNAYIDNIMIYSYPAEVPGDETNPPGIFIPQTEKFKTVDSTITTPILGRIYDESTIDSVEIKRVDSETWNSCTVDSEPSPVTLPTPLAKWSFEEESGTGAYLLDSSGNGYHATPSGTTVGEGIVGNGRSIGAWNYIEVDSSLNNDIPSGSEARTVSAWVKFETNEGCPTGWNPVFSYGSEDEVGENVAWGVVIDCDRSLGVNEGTSREFVEAKVPSWEWTFVAVSMDSNGNKTHYINGENVGTITTVPNTIPDHNPKIGILYHGHHSFPGIIDEVSLFDRALSEEEIINIFSSTKDNYEFSCSTGPMLDLSTNAYQIRATDQFNNVTAVENYEYVEREVDAFGGLELKTLLRFESGNTLLDSIGTLINGYAYEGGTNPITSIPRTTGIYGDAGDFQDIRRLFFPDNSQIYDFNDYEDKLPHFRVEAIVKRLYEDTHRSILVKTLSEEGEPLWKMGTSDTSNLLCSVVTLGGTVTVISDETLPIDEWRAVACDWNALTGELTASIDGIDVKTETTNIDISLRQLTTSTGPLVISGMGQDSYYDPFNGFIDNVKIYNEYLTIPKKPIELNSSSALANSDTYLLQGSANTNTSDNIVQVQYREYAQGQNENVNWNGCTCDDGTCDNPTEDFSCSITNIPESSTTTYEIRYVYGDPLSYLASNLYGISDIRRDSNNSLEAWWSFDKATELIDYTGNGFNGTLIGVSPLYSNLTTGSLTNIFDGNTYFEIADTERKLNFNGFSDEFKIELDIKPDAGLTTNEDYHFIYKTKSSWEEGEQPYVWGIRMYVTPNGDYVASARVDDNGERSVGFEDNPNSYLNPGQWNHIVFTYSNVDEVITLKVNDNDTIISEIYQSMSLDESSAPVTIGSRATDNNKFVGEIDDIKIYNETYVPPYTPFEFSTSAAIVSTNTYTLQGTADTIDKEISTIQYRLFNSSQAQGDNWSSCTCDDGTCNSVIEDFSCNIADIPAFTSTYELRLGYGEPLEYITSETYGRFDITKDTSDSLVTWWGFDSDTNITDYGVNELDGTVVGHVETSISSETGSRTNVFHGDTYFEIADTERKLNFNDVDSEFTVELDIKPEIGFNTNQDYYIMTKNAPDSSFVWGIKIYVTLDGDYDIRGIINTENQIKEIGHNDLSANSNTYLTPGDWNHVVFSFANLDSTATIKVNDNPPSVYSNSIYFLMPTSTSPITIGGNPAIGNKFEGEIGDIKIYSTTDARAPQITFKELDNKERITNDPNQEFEITVTDQTGVESFGYFFFDMSGSWDIPEPGYIPIADREWTYVDNPTEGNWGDKEVVIKINAVDLSDKLWYLYTRATDSNGFESLLPDHWWYTTYAHHTPSAMPYYQFFVEARDTTPPQIFAHSIIPSQTVDTNPGVRGYIKDNPKDTISDIASIEYKLEIGTLEGEDWTPGEIGTWKPITPLGIENIFDQPTEEFYLRLEGLTPGDYKLEIRAEDASGNSTEDNDTNHTGYFTIYEINPKPDTTVLIKEEDFTSHAYHDQLFSDGVWGNGILRLRQSVSFQQEQAMFTNNNDFGYTYGEFRGEIFDSVDGNFWIVNNDQTFSYYNIENDTYTKYPKLKKGWYLADVNEFEFEDRRYLVIDYVYESTIIYDINNTPEDTTDDTYVDYKDKEGFGNNKDFEFIDIDRRNNTLSIFGRAEPAVENFVISIDTKGTIMDISDDTYTTWGTADNLFYDEDLEEYHTDHDIVGLLLDQELDSFVMSTYTHGSWICSDGGDPENKTNDACKYYPTWGKFSIIKDNNGYYYLGGNGRLVRINSNNTSNLMDDTLTDIVSIGDPRLIDDTVSDMVIIPGKYPVGDELWFLTTNGYLRGVEYNFTYDDKLDDTTYVYKIPTHQNRGGSGTNFSLRGDDTFYVATQGEGIQKITLTRSFESLNTIEMLPIPPDGILAINYIDLEEVLGAVTNGSQYTLNDLVTYEVSNDSGVTWFPITQGQRVNFPTPDYKLKLKIILRSGSSPIIDALKLSYVAYPEKKDDQCDIKINDKAPQITSIKPNTNKSFTVNFATLADPTVQSYTLEYGLSNSNFTTGSQTVLKDTNTFTVTGIQEDTEYFFRVKAVSDCTSSLWSNVMSATNTGEATQPPVKPHRPPKATDPTTEENLCGNGVLDEGEECDYANTETYMCEDGSTGICTVECTLDVNSCKEEDSDIPIIDRIKENIKEVEKERDGEAISATQVANWAVKLISLSLLTLSVPLIPYYFMRILLGIPYIIGMRKRDKEYGYVYDSITKEPIKQAIVRIYSGDKLVHTDVTGTYGEFGGNIEPGKYTLSVQKPQYSFPSTMVVGSTDMHISNVYNGTLEVKENAEIITAVPIDSNKAKVFDIFKTIVINRTAILLQFIKLLLFVGLLAYSIYAYKTNSNTLNLIVLIEYAIVLAVLLLSSLSRDIKYGKITNAYDEPVVGVNVGLFEREFDKLQTERVTNEKGQYRFIIKPGTYEIRSLTPGYTLQDNNVITVNDKPSIINRDLKITNSR